MVKKEETVSYKEVHPKDGTVIREWVFGQPQLLGSTVRFPFRFWTMSMGLTEMADAEVCISIGSQNIICNVVLEASNPVIRSDGGKTKTLRSYLNENGYFDLNMPSGIASQGYGMLITTKRKMFRFPPDVVGFLFKHILNR